MALRKLASNVVYLMMDWVSITILSFFFWIIFGKLLNSTELGIVSTAFNLSSVIQYFSTLGIGVALYKLVSEHSDDNNRIPNIIGNAMKFLLFSSIIVTILIFMFAKNLSPFIKLAPEVILISSITAVFLAFSNTAGYILAGLQNMRKYMLTNLFFYISKLVISTSFVLLGFSFFGPLLGMLLGYLLLIIIRLDVFINIKTNSKSKDGYNEIFMYATPAFIGGIATIAFNNIPYITLTVIKNLSVTGIFTPAMLLATPLVIFPTIFANALFPIISNLSSGIRKEKETAFLLNTVFRYSILFTLPLAIFLIFFSDRIILLLFKPEYLSAVELLKILSIGALLQGLSGIFLSSIYALKKPKVQQDILITIAIMFTILSLPLTYYLSAIGMTIAYVISGATLFTLSYFYVKKLLIVRLPHFDTLKILISSLLMVAFIILLKPIVWQEISILLILPTILIYFITLLFLNFYNESDLRLVKFLSDHSPNLLKIPLKLVFLSIKRKLDITSRK